MNSGADANFEKQNLKGNSELFPERAQDRDTEWGPQVWKGKRETVIRVRRPSETRLKEHHLPGLTCVFSGLFVLSANTGLPWPERAY